MAHLPFDETPGKQFRVSDYVKGPDGAEADSKLVSMRVEISYHKVTFECADAVNNKASLVSFTMPPVIDTVDDFQRIATPHVALMYEMLTGEAVGFVKVAISSQDPQ